MDRFNSRTGILALLLVFVIIVSALSLGGCSFTSNSDLTDDVIPGNTEYDNQSDLPQSDTSDFVDVTDSTLNGDDSADSSDGLTLLSSYTPKAAYDENGKEISLDIAFGTGYSSYGGSLQFNDDGTFFVCVGVGGNPDNHSGTYIVISNSEIELKFNNGSVKKALILRVENKVAKEIKLDYNDVFTVLFSE